jgi:hypothetical protein
MGTGCISPGGQPLATFFAARKAALGPECRFVAARQNPPFPGQLRTSAGPRGAGSPADFEREREWYERLMAKVGTGAAARLGPRSSKTRFPLCGLRHGSCPLTSSGTVFEWPMAKGCYRCAERDRSRWFPARTPTGSPGTRCRPPSSRGGAAAHYGKSTTSSVQCGGYPLGGHARTSCGGPSENDVCAN